MIEEFSKMNKFNISGRNRLDLFCNEFALKNFAKFTGQDMPQIPFFTKVAESGAGLVL